MNPVVFFANPTHAARLAQIHAEALPDDARIRARIAVYRQMIGDFRPLTDPLDLP